jgi:serine/threonine-protein kinase HipA
VPLADHHVACRLKALADNRGDSWYIGGEHWSLGGTHGKFALAWHGGWWCSCQGSAATTHIFKNGVAGYMLQALNEYVCMKLAARCRLRTAEVEYRLFEDEPALIVKRFDCVEEGGKTNRLHHEDCARRFR